MEQGTRSSGEARREAARLAGGRGVGVHQRNVGVGSVRMRLCAVVGGYAGMESQRRQ